MNTLHHKYIKMYYKCTTKVYITNELLQTESIRNILTLPQFADYSRSLPIIAEWAFKLVVYWFL